MPTFMCLFVVGFHEKLMEPEFNSKYGAFYNDFKIENKGALLYHSVFVIRRYLFALTCVYLTDYPHFQIQLFAMYSIFYLWYLIAVRPFRAEFMNYIEIMNETVILLCSSSLFVFTRFVSDSRLQFQVGMGLVVTVLANIGVNILFAIINTIVDIYQTLKRRSAKKDREWGSVSTRVEKIDTYEVNESALR